MQEEWEGKRIARQFAGYIIKLWRAQQGSKSTIEDALQQAIDAFYGSKQAFYEQFLQHLDAEKLQYFYKLLHDYLEDFHDTMGGIDPEELAQIRDQIKSMIVGDMQHADETRTVSPSSRLGSGPYKGGKGGGRQ